MNLHLKLPPLDNGNKPPIYRQKDRYVYIIKEPVERRWFDEPDPIEDVSMLRFAAIILFLVLVILAVC